MLLNAKGWACGRESDFCDFTQIYGFPGLSELSDVSYVRQLANKANLQGDAFKLVHARIKPGRYCHIAFRLIQNDDVKPEDARFLIVKIGYEKYNFPVCWVFPQDPAIKHLPDFISDKGIKSILADAGLSEPKLTPTLDGGGFASILRYRPEQDCLIRIFASSMRTHGDINASAIYGRMFASRRQARNLFSTLQALGCNSRTAKSRLNTPQPLGLCERTNTVFYRECPGVVMTSLLGSPVFQKHVADAAVCLAEIHERIVVENTANTLQTRTAETELRRFEKASSFLDHPDSEVRRVLEKRLVQLRSDLDQVETDALVYLHGDYSTNQLLVGADVVSVIDMSETVGDPYFDLGSFLSRLRWRVSENDYRRYRDVFTTEYCNMRGHAFDGEALAWHLSLADVKNALVSYKNLRAGWQQSITNMLA